MEKRKEAKRKGKRRKEENKTKIDNSSNSTDEDKNDKVKETASELINAHGPKILTKIAKCHFKTTDEILHSSGFCRNDLIKD